MLNKLIDLFRKIKATKDIKKLSNEEILNFFIMSSRLKSINHLAKEDRKDYFIVRNKIIKECRQRGLL